MHFFSFFANLHPFYRNEYMYKNQTIFYVDEYCNPHFPKKLRSRVIFSVRPHMSDVGNGQNMFSSPNADVGVHYSLVKKGKGNFCSGRTFHTREEERNGQIIGNSK